MGTKIPGNLSGLFSLHLSFRRHIKMRQINLLGEGEVLTLTCEQYLREIVLRT